MAEHQRRYVVRWLKERLTGRPERGDLLYEHHILIVHDRLLKRLIVKAGQDVEGSLTDGLVGAFGDATLDHWSRLLAQPDNDHASLQQWLWAVPARQSTHQMRDVFTKIDRLYAIGVHEGWPMLCNDAAVRHYARRCARRPPAMSKRIEQRSRRLEAACFMRYALCSATDQLGKPGPTRADALRRSACTRMCAIAGASSTINPLSSMSGRPGQRSKG
jgi:hypothetical protein